jgi:oligopeptide transport system permease protein
MLRFFISRLVQAVVVMWVIVTATFALIKAAPGGPYASERVVSETTRAEQAAAMGLDQPVWKQYLHVLRGLMPGGALPSQKFEGWTVQEIIGQGFPISLQLGLAGLAIALVLGLPLGILAAARQNSAPDHALMAVATLGLCLPTFVSGPLLALWLGIKWRWFNVAGWIDSTDWVLPALTLGLFYTASIARMARMAMLEILGQDFIRTARAKGASELAVLVRHGMRSALLPVVAYLGPMMAGLVTGSFIVENTFQIPGLGQHFVSSAVNRDLVLACGVAVVYGGLLVGANLLVDLAQAWLNPKIRLQA